MSSCGRRPTARKFVIAYHLLLLKELSPMELLSGFRYDAAVQKTGSGVITVFTRHLDWFPF